MTERDQYTQQQIASVLVPGEQVRNMAIIRKMPGLMVQIALSICCGYVVIAMLTKHYYAVLTDRRLILVQTGMGFFNTKLENRGVTSIDLSQVQRVTEGGFLNNKAFTLHMADGTTDEYRVSPWSKAMEGQARWLDDIKNVRSLQG